MIIKMNNTKLAFLFDETVFKKEELPQIKVVKNYDMQIKNNPYEQALAYVTASNELLGLANIFINYCTEKAKTRELRRQCEIKKRALDAYVDEVERRVDDEIYHYRKRRESEIEYRKRNLSIILEQLQKEAELEYMKVEKHVAKEREKSKIIAEVRKQIKQNLDYIEELIVEADKNKINNNKYYYQLQERYRVELKNYSKNILMTV